MDTIIDTAAHYSGTFTENAVWFWIAMLEFVIIVLFLLLKKRRYKPEFVGISKVDMRSGNAQSADMQNLVASINQSGQLYKELSRSCHPDRFVNTHLQADADRLFQEISRHRRNYRRLLELKQEAKEKLGLTFNE
jgi:preprotein translocase subunit SecF